MMTLVATQLISLGRRNTTQEEERVFIMGATVDALDANTSMDPSTAKRLVKKFREKKKQLINSKESY